MIDFSVDFSIYIFILTSLCICKLGQGIKARIKMIKSKSTQKLYIYWKIGICIRNSTANQAASIINGCNRLRIAEPMGLSSGFSIDFSNNHCRQQINGKQQQKQQQNNRPKAINNGMNTIGTETPGSLSNSAAKRQTKVITNDQKTQRQVMPQPQQQHTHTLSCAVAVARLW